MLYTCIVCPKSCRVNLEEVNGEFQVSGNVCKRGKVHAIAEHTCPMRMITTTVKIENATLPRLPVISTAEVPKDKLDECFRTIYATKVVAPIKEGEILVPNIEGLGVDIIASRTIHKK